MRAEVVGVGTEILLGHIANTNARHVSEALAGIGVDVLLHTAVGDNEERIAGAVRAALARADVVLISGGLGPTHDDVTREAVARATGRPLALRPDLERALTERFAAAGRRMPESNLRQAHLPEGAEAIPNPLGTAPGFRLDVDRKRIYALPGVPSELGAMLAASVLPDLAAVGGREVLVSRMLKVAGVPEAEVGERLRPLIERLDREPGVTAALLSSGGEVRVRLSAKAASREAALAAIAPVQEEARTLLGTAVFGADADTLESTVSGLLRERKLTIAVAESVTGGLVASRIVSVPGASDLLLAGYVAYSVEAKVRDLGVSADLIAGHGAVSIEVAVAMAGGARARAGADLGLATTGVAGPEPDAAPVGTVCVALAWAEGAAAEAMLLPGDREGVRRRASQAALDLARRWLAGGHLPGH